MTDFLEVLDTMIESTDEFIRDDKLTVWNDKEGRYADMGALAHVRQLYRMGFEEHESDIKDSAAPKARPSIHELFNELHKRLAQLGGSHIGEIAIELDKAHHDYTNLTS